MFLENLPAKFIELVTQRKDLMQVMEPKGDVPTP